MLIEKLFPPRWKHKNPQVRKRALMSLKPERDESQKIFLDVLQNDPELYIQRIAIQGLNNISRLQSLRESSKHTEIYQAATRRLCELLATCNKNHPVSYLKNLLSSISENRILEYVALHANNEELQLYALSKVANESVLTDILHNGQFENNKKYALEGLHTVNSLKRAVKILKRKDKQLTAKAQEMLDALLEKSRQETELQKVYKRIANEFMELINLCKYSGEWKKYESRLRDLHSRCRSLASKLGSQSSGAMPVTLNDIEEAFAFFEDQVVQDKTDQAEKPNWGIDAVNIPSKPAPAELNRLKEVCDSLDLLIQYTVKTVATKSTPEAEIENSLFKLRKNWHEAMSGLEDANVPDAYSAEVDDLKFRFTQGENQLEEKLAEITRVRSSANDIEDFNNRALTLLENENTSEIDKISALLDSFNTDKIPDHPLIPPQLASQAKELYTALEKRLDDARQRNEALCEEFAVLTGKLEKALANGKARVVKQLLNRGRNILKQLSEKYLVRLEKNQLTKTFNQLVRQSDSLLGWQQWSTATVKEQLIEEMEILADRVSQQSDSDFDYSSVASEIRQARARWKQAVKGAGDKDQDTSMWEKFDTACNRAFEPCQEYFNRLEKERSSCLEKREKICQDLEKYYETVSAENQDNVDWRALEKIIRVARADWGKLGEVSHRDRGAINKRFNAVMHQLEKLARNRKDENKREKKLLISRVEAAVKHLGDQKTDLDTAIDVVKDSQAQWKSIGPAHKDKQLWNDFKSVCDSVFSIKKSAQEKIRQEEAELNRQRDEIVEKINQYAKLDDEGALESRSEIEQLKSTWRELPKLSRDNKKEQSFNRACEHFAKKIQQVKNNQLRTVKQQIQKNVGFCYQLEKLISDFLSGNIHASSLSQNAENLGLQWNSVDEKSLGFSAAIDERFQQLKKYVSDLEKGKTEEFRQYVAEQHENRLRNKEELCIHLEILANKESPEESRQKRMEIQVARLADSMKQNTSPDLEQEIQRLLSQWHTSGFILPPESLSYEQRFYSALQLVDKDYQYLL